jgi:upstream stimulatory factor
MQETFKEAERLQMDNELLRQQVSAGPELSGDPSSPRCQSQPWVTCALSHLQIEELKNENALLRAQLQQHNLEMVGESTRQ